MVRTRLPGINTVHKKLADGSTRTYFYHRATGIRLEGEPGTPEFVASYSRAQSVGPYQSYGRCSGLVRAFLTSAEFAGLAASTQKEYGRIFAKIEEKFGSAPLGALEDPRIAADIYAWRDKIAATHPREADNRMIVFGRLLSWALSRHLIKVNLLEGYKRIYSSDRSDKIWLPEHIAAFQRAANPEIWAIFLGALHTGLRQKDLRELRWSGYDGRTITWRITKRRKGSAGTLVSIPCTSALRKLLDSLPRHGKLIFTTRTGKAWTKRYLCRRFDEARKLAAETVPDIAELHFHDIRGTAITLLAEANATIPEIAAITGHSYRSVTSILEKYLPRTRHLAEMAISKLENSARTKFADCLQTGPSLEQKGDKLSD